MSSMAGSPAEVAASPPAASFKMQKESSIPIDGKENCQNFAKKIKTDDVSVMSSPNPSIPCVINVPLDNSEERTIDDLAFLQQLTDEHMRQSDELRDPVVEALMRVNKKAQEEKVRKMQETSANAATAKKNGDEKKKEETLNNEESGWEYPKQDCVRTMIDCPYDDCQMEFFFFSRIGVIAKDLKDNEEGLIEPQTCKRCGRQVKLKTYIMPVVSQLDPATDDKKSKRLSLYDPTTDN